MQLTVPPPVITAPPESCEAPTRVVKKETFEMVLVLPLICELFTSTVKEPLEALLVMP
jgi:hypothetical protein